MIRKVKFTDFVKRATSSKMQLTEFRFHTNSKVHSLLRLTKYGNFSENSKLTREAGRHTTLSGGSNLQVAGRRSQVAGHCFTNTETILT